MTQEASPILAGPFPSLLCWLADTGQQRLCVWN